MTHADILGFIPPTLLQAVNWLAAVVVLAEALNKLERANPFKANLCPRIRVAVFLKVLGWMCLALGAAGNLVAPLMVLERANLQSTAVMAGFAFLIIRTRIKETPL